MGAREEIDQISAEFFAAFDNRCGRTPGVLALRRLFGPGATITKVDPGGPVVMDVDGFIEPRAALLGGGSLTDFHEWEVEAETSVMGGIAERRSTYEKAGTLDGMIYSGRGRKLMQLYRHGEQWMISSILWQDD